MGGLGSGRYWGSRTKHVTDDYRSIDIRFLKRHGGLIPGYISTVSWSNEINQTGAIQIAAETDQLVFKYKFQSAGESWRDIDLPIALDWTSCNIGGKRPWFICPIPSCGKRAAILYADRCFVCRHCLNLVYESQYEDAELRASRKANRLREKLGWSNGILDGKGEKPKGMHLKKYNRLMEQYDLFVDQALSDLGRCR